MSKKRKDWRLYILDMLECIKRIENYVEGLSYEQFLMDDKTKDWESWNFRLFFIIYVLSFPSLSSRSCKSSRSITLGIVVKNIPHHSNGGTGLSFLKPLPIIILMEFRDYVAILGGLIGILATFTGIMWMLVQQINKRIDTVEKRIDDRINAVEKRIDDRMNAMEKRIDDRINAVEKRIDELRDDMDRRFNELREDIKGLREEIKEIRLLLYKVLEVPHKQGE